MRLHTFFNKHNTIVLTQSKQAYVRSDTSPRTVYTTLVSTWKDKAWIQFTLLIDIRYKFTIECAHGGGPESGRPSHADALQIIVLLKITIECARSGLHTLESVACVRYACIECAHSGGPKLKDSRTYAHNKDTYHVPQRGWLTLERTATLWTTV